IFPARMYVRSRRRFVRGRRDPPSTREEQEMSTLAVVEQILRESDQPLSVREIVERAGPALPTKSKTPDTVVARDLSMDIKRKAEASLFVRTSPGRYTLRDRVAAAPTVERPVAAEPPAAPSPIMSP